MIYTNLNTPLGEVTASAEGDALTGLWFVGQKYYPSDKDKSTWSYDPNYPIFKKLDQWLEDYFAGKRNIALPNLEPKGTAFQKPFGQYFSKYHMAVLRLMGKLPKK